MQKRGQEQTPIDVADGPNPREACKTIFHARNYGEGVGHLWSDPLRKLFTISLLKLQLFEQPARDCNRTRAVTTIGEIPSGRIETFIVLLALILTFVGRTKLELGDPE